MFSQFFFITQSSHQQQRLQLEAALGGVSDHLHVQRRPHLSDRPLEARDGLVGAAADLGLQGLETHQYMTLTSGKGPGFEWTPSEPGR